MTQPRGRSRRTTAGFLLAAGLLISACGGESGTASPGTFIPASAAITGGTATPRPSTSASVNPVPSVTPGGASPTIRQLPSSGPSVGTPGPTSATAAPSTGTDPCEGRHASPGGPASPSAAPGGPSAGVPPSLGLQPVASGFSAPVGVVAPPDGSGRLFVVEQTGSILVIDGDSVLGTPFLDLSGRISSGGERGLLGLAFHPDYACNGRLFVDYTDRNGSTVVAEYRVSPDPNVADPTAVATLLNVDQPYANHNGGDIHFGPDGLLYVALGDGGNGGDPLGNGQRPSTLLGTLLRIDVDHPAGDHAYGTPADNCRGCPADARPEVFAYGLRNPWRFSFDRATRDLWIGDVGQARYEEIDHVPAGAGSGDNFGWNRMEGFHCYPGGTSCDRSGLTLPVAEYNHSIGDCAVIGGYVYRGNEQPALTGWYLFSDNCSGRIRAIPATATTNVTPTVALETGRQITSFGEDALGELYVTDAGRGEVLRIVVP